MEVGDRVLVKVVAFDGKHKLADKWEEAVYWRNVLDSIIIIKKRKEKPTGGGTPETHLRKQVVISRIFKRMVPIDYSYQSKKKKKKKRNVRNLFFYLSSNSFASFPSQTSNLVHSSLAGHPGLPATTCIYLVGLLPVELNVLFILVLRR